MVVARALRGMNDLWPKELKVWRKIENAVKEVFPLYGFSEIRTPILEELALFKRGIGEETDIVEKEMFIVPDGENTYCLRPENTAPVVRAMIERGALSQDTQEKLFYLGPMFRKERPQLGRLRQFHQFGIESFGLSEPIADIEIIAMVNHLFEHLKLPGLSLKINSLGTSQERQKYKESLLKYLGNHQAKICEDCQRRMVKNPLRILDCKKSQCQEVAMNAPKTMDALENESRTHFEEVLLGLDNLSISYEVDFRLVRGLDYYNRTVFEFLADVGLGAQNAVAAGGRYDGLFTTLGHKIDLPAIGCAGGIERVALLLKDQEEASLTKGLALVAADEAGFLACKTLAFELRKAGVVADFSMQKKSLKAQMRRADKLNFSHVAVLGEQEIASKKLKVKNMQNGESQELLMSVINLKNNLN